jgi:hypothetical protein
VPRDPAGTYTVASELDIPEPSDASAAFAPLVAASDGPDDPARYLVDRMIDQLPPGTAQTLARDAAPLLAAYLNDRLADVAPRLRAGLVALASGLEHVGHHLGTVELWQLDASGAGTRTLVGARYAIAGATIDVRFVDRGLPDASSPIRTELDYTGRLTVDTHGLPLRYGSLVRAGLDRAVVPSIAPGTEDLGSALAQLVDCGKLGQLIADRLQLGAPALYRAACDAAANAIAQDVYTHLDALDAVTYELDLAGSVDAGDGNSDGRADVLRAGVWTGAVRSIGPIGAATFTGQTTEPTL